MNICVIVFQAQDFKHLNDILKKFPAANIDVLSIIEGVNCPNDFESSKVSFFKAETYIELLSNKEISRDCSFLASTFAQLSKKSDVSIDLPLSKGKIGLSSALLNMTALGLQPVLTAIAILERHFTQYDEYTQVFSKYGGKDVILPERSDVKFWYYPELTYGSLVKMFCKNRGVQSQGFDLTSYPFKVLKNKVRSYLIFGFKCLVSTRRLVRDFGCEVKGDVFGVDKKLSIKTILILVRAESEWNTVKNLYHQLKNDPNFNPIIIQDDLLKHPSGYKVLRASQIPFNRIHSIISLHQFLLSWVGAFIKLKRLSRRFNFKQLETKALRKVEIQSTSLGKKQYLNIAKQATFKSLRSLGELSLFSREMDYWINQTKCDAVLMMDMVDQWCAVMQKISLANNVKSYILQNTCLDDLIYPLPVCADVMLLNNLTSYKILSQSLNIPSKKLKLVGSPSHDALFTLLQQQDVNSLKQKHGVDVKKTVILVATQPFVQAYPYNQALIEDLLCVIHKLKLSNMHIIIKPHPRETHSEYKKYIKRQNFVDVQVSNATDIIELMAFSDLMVSRTSTAIESALLVGLPVISYLKNYPLSICDRLSYLKSEATKISSDSNCFEKQIGSFFVEKERKTFQKNRSKYIEEEVGFFDGQSSVRILSFLKQQLSLELIEG